MEPEATSAVPIPCSRASRLHLSWGPGNSLLACPVELKSSEASAGSLTAFQTISSVRWCVLQLIDVSHSSYTPLMYVSLQASANIVACCRGALPASSRRVAYDSLPAFKALHTSKQDGAHLDFPTSHAIRHSPTVPRTNRWLVLDKPQVVIRRACKCTGDQLMTLQQIQDYANSISAVIAPQG